MSDTTAVAINIDALVQSRIQSLVKEVQEHVRKAALEAVRLALSGSEPRPAAGAASAARAAAKPAVASASKKKSKPKKKAPSRPVANRKPAAVAPGPAEPAATSSDGSAQAAAATGSPGDAPAPSASAPEARQPTSKGRLDQRLLAYIRAQPGQRTEQIAQGMRVESKRLKPLLKRFVRKGVLRTSGQRRGTQYFPVAQ